MYTVLLEVKNNNSEMNYNKFYNPAPSEFRKFPKSENGIKKAVDDLIKVMTKNMDWITDYRLVFYEGKYESHKDMKPFVITDSKGVSIIN